MCPNAAIIYNDPDAHDLGAGYYASIGEEVAECSIIEEVEAVDKALSALGYSVDRVPLRPPLRCVRERLSALRADIVFNLFEGFDGRPQTEAVVATNLAEMKLNYTGSPAAALSLAVDKPKCKAVLRDAGIDVPRYQILTPENLSRFKVGYPCIVKPWSEDASHGISEKSVVKNATELAEQVANISRTFGRKALVEEYIDGRELNISVLGVGELTTLPISEIMFSLPEGLPRILTFAAKWDRESPYFQGTGVACPAEIPEELSSRMASIAIRAFSAVGCRGYARIDFRLSHSGELKVLEVNPNPDITPGNGAARQAETAGMNYDQFIEKIASFAFVTVPC